MDILRVTAPVPIGVTYSAAVKAVVAGAAAAATKVWRSSAGVGKAGRGGSIGVAGVGFAASARAAPAMPEPAMGLPDVVPLLLKGLVRGEAATHAARALVAVVPVVGRA